VIDPDFYGWDDGGDSGDDRGLAANNYVPYSDDGDPYSQGPPYEPEQPYPGQAGSPALPPSTARPPYSGSTPSGAVPEEQLTLIFKDGRAPRTVRNYIMNTKELTDIDPQHFERIPLNEIDIAATVKANRARGVEFEVPSAAPDQASR
jgi:hypothetical protein